MRLPLPRLPLRRQPPCERWEPGNEPGGDVAFRAAAAFGEAALRSLPRHDDQRDRAALQGRCEGPPPGPCAVRRFVGRSPGTAGDDDRGRHEIKERGELRDRRSSSVAVPGIPMRSAIDELWPFECRESDLSGANLERERPVARENVHLTSGYVAHAGACRRSFSHWRFCWV